MISLTSIEIPGKNKIPDIQINSGQMIGVFGGTNSGKSAILLAILGQSIITSKFKRSADIDNSEIAYIPTNISHLFSGMKSTLRGEMKLSSQFLGRTIPDIEPIAKRFNVDFLLDRSPFDLSGGEMVRAALAINAVKNPKIWLLDQIFDFLHPEAAKEIHDLLLNERKYGNTVVETHSTMPLWSADFSDNIFLENEKNIIARRPDDYRHMNESELTCVVSKPIQGSKPICSIDNIEFQYKNDGFKLGPITTHYFQKDIVAITGPNGSGKTTLLQCIANLNKGMTGHLSIQGGSPTRDRWLWARKALYCFQNPDDQLYQPTVFDEIKTTIMALGRIVPKDLEKQICAFGLEDYVKAEPYQLARPLRRMVCLATALLSGSPVILLDEPTANIDGRLKAIIYERICTLAKNGSVVVIVSHDFPFVSAVANRVLRLSDGKLQN